MSWDKKKGGAATGYYYETQRVPGKPHPVKVYRGRGVLGRLAAALVEARRKEREATRAVVRAQLAATATADQLAADLFEWAKVLAEAWLAASGHHRHRGEWRMRRGQAAAQGGVAGVGAGAPQQPGVREGNAPVADRPGGRR